jgi:hypothetical protein
MAGRKRANVVRESNINQSMIIWVGVGAVLMVMALTFYGFGFDMGFVRVGGHMNTDGLLWGAGICIALSYVCDIMFVNTARKFFDNPPSWIAYIPYVGMIALFDSWSVYLAWAVSAIGVLIALAAFTSFGQLLPVDIIQMGYTKMSIAIILCMLVFTVIRGTYCLLVKRDALRLYNEQINDSFGGGGSWSFFSYAVYFIPIIRMLSLYTDINLLNNIKIDLDTMKAREE